MSTNKLKRIDAIVAKSNESEISLEIPRSSTIGTDKVLTVNKDRFVINDTTSTFTLEIEGAGTGGPSFSLNLQNELLATVDTNGFAVTKTSYATIYLDNLSNSSPAGLRLNDAQDPYKLEVIVNGQPIVDFTNGGIEPSSAGLSIGTSTNKFAEGYFENLEVDSLLSVTASHISRLFVGDSDDTVTDTDIHFNNPSGYVYNGLRYYNDQLQLFVASNTNDSVVTFTKDQIQATPGSISAPSYSFEGDSNTGFARGPGVSSKISVVISADEVAYFDDIGLYSNELRVGGGHLKMEDATPNDTRNVLALYATGNTVDVDIAIVPKGSGALLSQVPDNTTTGGNKRGINAVDLQLKRIAATEVASGDLSVLLGGQNNTASGLLAIIVGGENNTSSGERSVVVSGSNNITSGQDSFIGSGNTNTVSDNFSFIGSGQNNLIEASTSGEYSFIGTGSNNQIKSNYNEHGFIGAGNNNIIWGDGALVRGSDNEITDAFLGNGFSNTISFGFLGYGFQNSMNGSYSFIGTGHNNIADGYYTFIGVGHDNSTDYSSYSFIGSGTSNTVDEDYSAVVGGFSQTVQARSSFIGSGYSNTITPNADESVISGGTNNVADNYNTWIPGGSGAKTRNVGMGAYAVGYFDTIGDSQAERYVLRRETTSDTPLALTAYGNSNEAAINQISLEDNSVILVEGRIAARCHATGEVAVWTIQAAAKRGVGANTVALVGAPVIELLHADHPAWKVSVEANTTEGALTVRVTGELNKTIKWVMDARAVGIVG